MESSIGWLWLGSGALAVGIVVAWQLIVTLIELRRTAREARRSLRRLTPLAEETLRQTRALSAAAAQRVEEIGRFAHESPVPALARGLLGTFQWLRSAFTSTEPSPGDPDRRAVVPKETP